jgi:hypothetical protein
MLPSLGGLGATHRNKQLVFLATFEAVEEVN